MAAGRPTVMRRTGERGSSARAAGRSSAAQQHTHCRHLHVHPTLSQTHGICCCRIAELALPLTISQFFSFALSLIAVAFIGRLGEEEMAISVLATSFMNMTGFSLVLGLLGAVDTLCGQAWGARNYRALGVTLQKAVVTTLATSLAVCLLWAHMEWLMLAVGQQPRIAAGAARFLLLATPALMFAGMFECIKRYLMAQVRVVWQGGRVCGWQGGA